jgi:hypothetical protein
VALWHRYAATPTRERRHARLLVLGVAGGGALLLFAAVAFGVALVKALVALAT